ncbi:hypothetical protein ABZ642_46370, partial [Streptomyces sp. NPDC007157]|uniref:hypothetical protein n=1 Tax=Streptomyces sp. NPDC007157 TaxID=3154681 RepID=UPI0033F85FAF
MFEMLSVITRVLLIDASGTDAGLRAERTTGARAADRTGKKHPLAHDPRIRVNAPDNLKYEFTNTCRAFGGLIPGYHDSPSFSVAAHRFLRNMRRADPGSRAIWQGP